MYNFFVDSNDISDNEAKISGNDFNHIKNVLRMKKGTKILINNKENEQPYLAEISNIGVKEITCTLLEKMSLNEMPLKVTLFQGIPKTDKMEYIIQKSVELGVYDIYPVVMKNCVAKINNEETKIKRWNTISETAAKQSKRNIIPKVYNKISFKEMEENLGEYDLIVLAYENEKNINLKNVLKESKNVNNIAIIIGPEGGLDLTEVEGLEKNGAKIVSLGKRILRTETASIAMLSMIIYEYEMQ